MLSFRAYKDYGEICFDKVYTERLLEQLEDAQERLANMLTSKYVVPLHNEVSGSFGSTKMVLSVRQEGHSFF